ncbi:MULTISPECIES: formimidoylglutamase [Providencia]|uniref:Formimidoylglutamase n=2 Tax=Providencia rustigianii TaxID=158850 RepID=D1P3B7_9GAMM|nr:MULTISPECIES: formimidoylglutamase [Providencia]EFB72033.1 formimidoylglutamase [Providencia rustigianii DSM 4541]MTC55193.1 formimidoylglutamase [Providencia rustigianii]SPY78140.1 Formimidoylglutamase [Providencia rustigianii]SUC27766.1 Formimidoylglutamase [Providencia rustigianii]
MSQPFVWQGRTDGETAEHLRIHQVINQFSPAKFALLGFASDEGVRRNKGREGAKAGPDEIRRQLAGLPIHQPLAIRDAGTVSCDDGDLESAQRKLSDEIIKILEQKQQPIILGGGHEVGYASFQGVFDFVQKYSPEKTIGIINFDAHFDLREASEATSGTPFLQASQLCKQYQRPFNYLCLGIADHGNTKVLFNTADRLGCQYIRDKALTSSQLPKAIEQLRLFIDSVDYLYITVDLDVFSAGIAPGVSAPAARGISTETFDELFNVIKASGKIALFDIAECNPAFDIDNHTSKLAAYLIYQYLF